MPMIMAQNAHERAALFARSAPAKSPAAKHDLSLHAITMATTPNGGKKSTVVRIAIAIGEPCARR